MLDGLTIYRRRTVIGKRSAVVLAAKTPLEECVSMFPVAFLLRARCFDDRARSGLEGQLLGVTIQHEQPELEKAKSVMLRQEEGFKVIKQKPDRYSKSALLTQKACAALAEHAPALL